MMRDRSKCYTCMYICTYPFYETFDADIKAFYICIETQYSFVYWICQWNGDMRMCMCFEGEVSFFFKKTSDAYFKRTFIKAKKKWKEIVTFKKKVQDNILYICTLAHPHRTMFAFGISYAPPSIYFSTMSWQLSKQTIVTQHKQMIYHLRFI